MDIFENNTLSSYTNNFKHPLVLKEEHDVGLAEIQYSQSWNNIRANNNTFEIHYSYQHNGKEHYMIKKVPPGYYETITDLIEVIDNIYRSTPDKISKDEVDLVGLEITYNSSTRRVNINIDNLKLKIKREGKNDIITKVKNASITLNDDIAKLLGFKHGVLITKGSSKMSDFAATPSGGLHQMYLYTDCIHPQPHPDGNVNILRTIAIDEAPNQKYVSKRFEKIYYYPLKSNTITTISFNLYDDTGKHIGFNEGKVLIVLHFRKRNL